MASQTYVGIDDDEYGGMTYIGGIIKDAWLFGILPEDQKCVGWAHGQIAAINAQVQAEWDKYGCMVSNLPEDLMARHREINDRAIARARELGWDPNLDPND
jgi:hypothetical protein